MKPTLRIAILRHGPYPEDPRVLKEARALISAGYEVDLFCLRAPGQPAKAVIDGVRVSRAPMSRRRGSPFSYVMEYLLSLLWMTFTITAAHAKRRYDLIQVNTLPDALIFATLIPRLFGARILFDMHEPTPELYATKYPSQSSPFMFRLHCAIERWAIQYAHLVLAVNETIRLRYIERGASPGKLLVVRNVPDEEIFGQPLPPFDAGGDFLLITHGTLQPRYGHEVILRAVPLIRDRIPSLRVEIRGEGETALALKDLARELHCEDLVSFTSSVPLPEMPNLLRRASIGLVPLLPCPFSELCQPNKLFEYVALGIPVIAARLAAIEETFDDDCVRFFTPGSHEELAQAIMELYASPDKRRSLVEQASRRYDTVRWRETRGIYLAAVAKALEK